MKDKISFKVTCPYCGRTLRVKKQIAVYDYVDDWGKILSDFETEEFHCTCGETFLGAETVQSEKIEKIVEVAKTLQSEGKFSVSKDGVKISLGFSDIWKLIREMKDLEGDFI
ncbi:MAG: hypothetical protein HXS46_11860 [Theionarchaea archaeon]|nr:MAG: hypothetical protein AYK18_00335 [Theionarchaea archaeon DG-70]MBU7011374.1 hypothetical protein [Theionarchaea archaeon]